MLTLVLDRNVHAVLRWNGEDRLPGWLAGPGFWAVSRDEIETTVVCPRERVPADLMSGKTWRAFRIAEVFDFDQPGILESVLRPLADAGIGIFAVSTFSSDHVLVDETDLDAAVAALARAGHRIRR
ncbi:ACT domain-containing protein [Rhizobium sp. TRM95111]|uniref:ACT domain-containing protein n=1 Tax=Rhizobium alarense TaxID=2846851 RepID=UPI001F2B9A16|nr:ACT domain-containing protein [Rhizobium alarense]MCF3640988.1 ACT domain-containing protein [Rhizobium alarense]